MRIYIGLISSSEPLLYEFDRTKDALIPKESRQQFPPRAIFLMDAYNPHDSRISFQEHLLSKCEDCDYLVVLLDEKYSYVCEQIRNACLIGVIQTHEVEAKNTRNFIAKRLSKLLRVMSFTAEKMAASEVEQAMRLPIRNFAAVELLALCALYQDEVLGKNLQPEANRLIAQLAARRRPRRRSSFATRYFIDDVPRYYLFGKETHERLPVGPPHESRCELNGTFRFGRRISTDKHFNVSEGDSDQTFVTGVFMNCHDATVTPQSTRTHLNMFSNDHC